MSDIRTLGISDIELPRCHTFLIPSLYLGHKNIELPHYKLFLFLSFFLCRHRTIGTQVTSESDKGAYAMSLCQSELPNLFIHTNKLHGYQFSPGPGIALSQTVCLRYLFFGLLSKEKNGGEWEEWGEENMAKQSFMLSNCY